MTDPRETPCIYVLAGTNGAGKSSIAGANIPEWIGYYNPDEVASTLRLLDPAITIEQASSSAWEKGKELLKRAIEQHSTFAFETTLGGDTITALLERALDSTLEVRIWYAGLSSPELHIARVRARVARGGHNVPEERIRARYDLSRKNLIQLLPRLTELRVYDNSEDANPNTGALPTPRLILHVTEGRITELCPVALIPQWAEPIVAAAETIARSHHG